MKKKKKKITYNSLLIIELLFHQLNSIKTLSENIADSTGLRAVYKAFEKSSINKYSSNNMRLNGLENINTRKLFFLSYAHVSILKN